MKLPYYEEKEYVRINGKKYKVIHPHRLRRIKKKRTSRFNFMKINPSGTKL